MNTVRKLVGKLARHYALPDRLDAIQESLGRIEARLNRDAPAADPREFEFRVYSQWGEDGIIDYIVRHARLSELSFIEFGVENYTEANTLFLLKHRNWRGLVMDGSQANIDAIRGGRVLWRYDLYAECAFITRENINDLISRNGFSGDVGLLSVDIDGNDYWVWDAINCISPRIVVAEYNSLFGPTAKLSTPYQADFIREKAHRSKMYYGASIAALSHLATARGYTLVAGNSAGNNVFFVRNDSLGTLLPQTCSQAYVRAAFREARTDDGKVELLSFSERQAAIASLPLIDVETGGQVALVDLA